MSLIKGISPDEPYFSSVQQLAEDIDVLEDSAIEVDKGKPTFIFRDKLINEYAEEFDECNKKFLQFVGKLIDRSGEALAEIGPTKRVMISKYDLHEFNEITKVPLAKIKEAIIINGSNSLSSCESIIHTYVTDSETAQIKSANLTKK